MTVSEVTGKLGLKYYTGEDLAENQNVCGCYIGDLLSLVMSKVQADNIWITIQTNINIVAVASLTEASCIIITDGFAPDEITLERAKEQGIIILGGDITAYEAASALSKMGI